MSKFKEIAIALQAEKYTGLSHEAASIEINRTYISAKKAIDTLAIDQYLVMQGLWPAIYQGVSDAAVTAVGTLSKFPAIEVQYPEKLAVLDAILQTLVDDPEIPQFINTHKDYILSMGDVLMSDADQLGYKINAGDIQASREI